MGTRFEPVGRCIYCGSRDSLSEEHIIPDALGGDMVLPAASCEPCGTMTSRFEQRVAADMFGSFRRRERVKGRRKLRRSVTVVQDTPRGRRGQTVDEAEVTAFLPFCRFLEPGFIRGLSPLESNWVGTRLGFHRDGPRRPPRHAHPAEQRFHTKEYAMMLAKIAHGVAVANLGLDSFDHWIPYALANAVARRQPSGLPFLVGNDPSAGEEPNVPRGQPGPSHELHCEVRAFGDRYYVHVKMRLFAPWGVPMHHVVVGPATRAFLAARSLPLLAAPW